jgi:hypothetical protein
VLPNLFKTDETFVVQNSLGAAFRLNLALKEQFLRHLVSIFGEGKVVKPSKRVINVCFVSRVYSENVSTLSRAGFVN